MRACACNDCDNEITPEMIEAGALEFARYDPRFESDEEAAVRIYQAMVSAKPELRKDVKSSTDTTPAGPICISQHIAQGVSIGVG
jgi:hypothetical protein